MNFAKLEEIRPKGLGLFVKKEPEDEEQNIQSPYHRLQSTASIASSEVYESSYHIPNSTRSELTLPLSRYQKVSQAVHKYIKFIGPGLMVSVSYMDPGNYSTAVAAGSAHQYKLLFSVLLSTVMAVFLQTLCAKLGAVTGLDLAQNCREHFSRRMNIMIYVLAEIAIIATDLAEVIGTAISLNILFGLPLIVGVIVTILDVLFVLLWYKPNGSMKITRIFEGFVSILVTLTVICFAIELFTIDFSVKEVLKGFLPSKDIVEGDGLYLSLAILGATVMPHSLYLGSGLVQPRLRDFDINAGNYKVIDEDDDHLDYRPSIDAINYTLNYSIFELVISLFTAALFVNCSILIVAGSALNGQKGTDLFSIYELLCNSLSKSAGLVFVWALLFSGQSAGIVCTMSGQMVAEGFLHWDVPPTIRRLITRSVAITPCLVLVLVSGRSGLSSALNASQVVLSLLLPFVSAPLIYLTSSKEIMRVKLNQSAKVAESIGLMDLNCEQIEEEGEEDGDEIILEDPDEDVEEQYKDMSNSLVMNIICVAIWGFITALNFFLLISMAMGKEVSF
jgi:metal iron transporter